MNYAISLLEIDLVKQESELEDNMRIKKSCDKSVEQIFKDGIKKNKKNIISLKKAIYILLDNSTRQVV